MEGNIPTMAWKIVQYLHFRILKFPLRRGWEDSRIAFGCLMMFMMFTSRGTLSSCGSQSPVPLNRLMFKCCWVRLGESMVSLREFNGHLLDQCCLYVYWYTHTHIYIYIYIDVILTHFNTYLYQHVETDTHTHTLLVFWHVVTSWGV